MDTALTSIVVLFWVMALYFWTEHRHKGGRRDQAGEQEHLLDR